MIKQIARTVKFKDAEIVGRKTSKKGPMILLRWTNLQADPDHYYERWVKASEVKVITIVSWPDSVKSIFRFLGIRSNHSIEI